MDVLGSKRESNNPSLPLSSLRLLVPPLQLVSAAVWHLSTHKDVLNYDKLQDFVCTVTEAIPGLIGPLQKAQLILGLRARLILELCKGSVRGDIDSEVIQNYLERFPITSTDFADAELRTTQSTFIALIQSLLKDPIERAYFFQEVFPVEYGPQFDTALHMLMWELLSKLEKLFPAPDIKQTAAWLASAPSVLEESSHPSSEELSFIFNHYKSSGLLKMTYGPSSTIGSYILSALSIPPSQKSNIKVGLESMHNYANPASLSAADQFNVVAVYTQVEVGESEAVELDKAPTDFYREEIVVVSSENVEDASSRTEEVSEAAEVAKALETLAKTFALRKESLVQEEPAKNVCGLESENERSGQNMMEVRLDSQAESVKSKAESCAEMMYNDETFSGQKTPNLSEENPDSSTEARRSICVQTKETPKDKSEDLKMITAASSPSVIAVKGTEKGDLNNTTSIIFTCSRCPFHSADEHSPPHFHMQSVQTEVYKNLSGAKFTPSPSSTDEIFTSIKLFPRGDSEETQRADPGSGASQKALSCDTCGKTFTRTSDVRRHQLTHTGERPFRCSRCDRTFQHSWDLAKHESKHHGLAVSFSCQVCGSSFPNLRALTVHHRTSHAQERRLPQMCSICSQSFPTSSALQEHRKTHAATKRYICQTCNEGFDSLLARSQHRQLHQVKRQFKCPHCEKTYTRRSDVKRHLSTHSGERPHQCNQCSKRFSLRFMLTKHLRVHTGERPFQCSHCPKRFTLVSVLARHERMHTGEKPFLCSQCGKGFLSQGELSKHHRSHVDDRPYSCPQCHKRFKSKKTQQEHIASHAGARPYPCSYCGKGFTKPYALTRHNLIHTGERPFPCGHCEKSFLTLGEAQLHRRIHTGERPYPCDACGLKFKSSSELARHKRSHDGFKRAKPFCRQCSKTFSSAAKLNKHLETHTDSME
ncbi:hypothetical protein OJAV_G00223460 [Oryzias javanicus]|uniref:C2H2-type domain-containing protein n=1 Tax=Oryzias javanicus TaxID=123683 RepID=A0A3S2NQ46_ORYJA|nr:hypothetical protein OJAV_G00223460 [Oryzias javanicus]